MIPKLVVSVTVTGASKVDPAVTFIIGAVTCTGICAFAATAKQKMVASDRTKLEKCRRRKGDT